MDFNEKNTVKVDFSVMERMVRDSERLATIREYISNHVYLERNVIKVLAGVEATELKEVKEGEK